jgi:cytochrome c-type biogenesis protein CcsB
MISIILFAFALTIYAIGTIFYEACLALKSQRTGRWATRSLVVGAVVHASALASRWLELGRAPLGNRFESLSLYAWLIVVFYLIVELRFGHKILGAFVSPLAFAAIAAASALPKGVQPLIPILQSHWLPVHVALSFLAYGLFTLAFAAAVVYLLTRRQLKQGQPTFLYYRLPPLEATEQLARRLAALGLPFMTVAIVTGSIWAEKVWGAPWIWDAKLNMALVTWLIYLVYFYARNVASWRGRRSAWLLILGFISVLVTYLGVNLFTSTVHGFIVSGR